jgi:formylglycine-generating enzyme required for sulfatase activity
VGYLRHSDDDEDVKPAQAASITTKPNPTQDKPAKEKPAPEKAAEKPSQGKSTSEKSAVVPAAASKVVAPQGGCPQDMKLVPGGGFRMGSATDDPLKGKDDKPLTALDVGAFCIDTLEFPNQVGSAPAVNVSWVEAQGKCEAQGKRLCKEAEWEKACKGPSNKRFPYGNEASGGSCNTADSKNNDGALAAAGKNNECQSGYGVVDMSGNAAEWVQSSFSHGGDRTQKGGSFKTPDSASRCASRAPGNPTAQAVDLGFRCCMPVGK